MDPESLHRELYETATTRTRKSLDLIHDVCRDQKKSGATDFSYATIGRLAKKRGGVGERSIYNATTSGKIYRAQIDAWARNTSDSIQVKQSARVPNHGGILDAIDKPSVRAEVSLLLSKVSRLEAQVSEFRQAANQDRVINLNSSPGFSQTNMLTGNEQTALRQAISPSFLSEQNWVLDKFNDIRTAKGGARVLPREYVNAIKKMLGETSAPGIGGARQLGD